MEIECRGTFLFLISKVYSLYVSHLRVVHYQFRLIIIIYNYRVLWRKDCSPHPVRRPLQQLPHHPIYYWYCLPINCMGYT